MSQARLRTTRAALQEYFSAQAPARVALEAGTHSGWVSRIAAVCGHEVIVAMPEKCARFTKAIGKTIAPTRRSWRGWFALIRAC